MTVHLAAPCFSLLPRLLVGTFAVLASHSAAVAADELVLHESLGQSWRNECVQFELSPAQLAHAKAGHSLMGPENTPVPFQLVASGNDGKSRIAFHVDLKPFEELHFEFTNASAGKPATDLVLDEAEFLTLRNSLTGISLRRTLKADQGPIAGWKLAEGGWVGDSRLKTQSPLTDYSVQVVARGPVYCEALCQMRFGADREWSLRLRVHAHEPVVVVEESFSTGDDAALMLALGTDFDPDRVFYRCGKDIVGRNATWSIQSGDAEPVFVLEPWLHWWERDRQGNWFGLYSSTGSNFVALAALQPGLWIDPARPAQQRSPAQIQVTQSDNNLWATFPLRGGQRKWMLMALDQDAALTIPEVPSIRGVAISKSATLPQKYLIKHGDFPLDRVKDVTRPWTTSPEDRARPLVSDDAVRDLKRRLRPDANLLQKYRQQPVSSHEMDEVVAAFLVTADAALGQHLADEAVRLLQNEVDNFYRQDGSPTLGVEPHRRANELLPAVNLAALMLGRGTLSPAQSGRLQSQLAFLADTVTRPDFYSPARGYSANPNMTSTVSAFQVRSAGAIPSHPKSADWMAGGMNELKRELAKWSDSNGGWLEAPHYAVVAYDTLLGCFLAAHASGQDDVLYDPRMKKVALWLAKMSSPPDARLNGWRHHLPIGNTYQQEVCSLYGHMAVLWRDKDPEFSAHMQWMHLQSGSPTSPGIGGFFPTLAGFRSLLLNPDLPAAAPAWTSELFPETGAILRSGFPSQRETQLSLIAGRNHDHYDDDSGSFTLWGKGSLLANDFGYSGFPGSDDHNMVISPAARRGVMRVEQFETSEQLDMVRGVRDGWTRRIVFVKDPDPLGANYFVLDDSVPEPSQFEWRIWLMARQVTRQGRCAVVQGQDDVDMDVSFPGDAAIQLRAEQKTRPCPSMRLDRSTDVSSTTTQTGLIASVTSDQLITVLFPRLRKDPPPEVTAKGPGIVRVRHQMGTDYFFLNSKPIEYKEGDISFAGTSGVIQLRDHSLALTLGSAGQIAARGHELREERAASKSWEVKK